MTTLPARRSALLAFLFVTATLDARGDDPKAPPAPVAADHAATMQKGLALFKEKVRPVLVARCLDCHGGKATKADFDLSDRKSLVASGVVEGGGKASRLYALITHAEEPHMPSKGPRLPAETIDAVARWIDLGAPFDKPLVARKEVAKKSAAPTDDDRKFWSFQPLRDAAPPAVKDPSWARTPIDLFILAALDGKGIAPNPPADRRTLIRRLSFDLVGLPPAPEEVEAFVNDPAPDAYEQLIDRLLASPRYGERWARYWMDVARFAESHGYEQDYDRPFAYHYRDFLIRAFNSDLPYDTFLAWQLAGDELAPGDPLAMSATGFLGAGAFPTQLTEAEFESARYNELDDMTSTTSSAFLGLSVGCARCHDHKFDPIPSEDYYRLAATFASTIRSEIDLPAGPGGKLTKVQITAEGFPHTKHHADDRGFPHFYPQAYILNRGDVNQKKSEAAPGVLRILTRGGKDADAWKVSPPSGSNSKRTKFRRAALARWMTDTKDGAGHMTARVIVNRLWQHHFGRGIVATPNDFGFQGERPTHPELLDRLALDLVTHGWTLKRLQRLIVLSAVYIQSSAFDESRARVDRDDAFLWRYAPRRLEAEPIRDALLAASGRLDSTMFGPGALDPNMGRRSVYFFIKRSRLIPTMMLFDWPEQLVSIGRRGTTTTAPQALMFMNSYLGRSCAEGLAERLVGLGSGAAADGYRIAFGRSPTPDESRLAAEFLAGQSAVYRRDGKPNPDRLALVDFCQALMSMSEFIYIP